MGLEGETPACPEHACTGRPTSKSLGIRTGHVWPTTPNIARYELKLRRTASAKDASRVFGSASPAHHRDQKPRLGKSLHVL